MTNRMIVLAIVVADVLVGGLAIYFDLPRPGLVVAAFNVLGMFWFMLTVLTLNL